MDAYNANPTSMQASIKSFLNHVSGESYLILGDMLELGEYSREEHVKILDLLKHYPKTKVFVVGRNFNEIASEYNCESFLNVDLLCTFLMQNKIDEGEILIKGSRGIQLEKTLNYL
jgi:UDP-N-acetylmuramoyl-tripeptide--D-alanyl-D-alanine ligase